MADDQKTLSFGDLWTVIRDPDSRAFARARQETLIVLTMSLIPLGLGAFLAWCEAKVATHPHSNLLSYIVRGSLGGQLYLVFLSLAATNFSRLWDSESVRLSFSGWANTINVVGAMICAGLLAIDDSMTRLNFFPLNVISVLFMLIALLHYFFLSVPGYIEKRDPNEAPRVRGEAMASALEAANGGAS